MTQAEMLAVEKTKAISNVPEKYALVSSGMVEVGDLLWEFVNEKWTQVQVAKPFKPGQKRPGWGQITEVGKPVSSYVAVARKVN